MVAAVTDFAMEATITGSPVATLSFSHDGIDLQAFLIQRRIIDSSDPWVAAGYFVPGDILESADSGFDNYAVDLIVEPGFEYRVLALDTDNSVST